MGKEVMKIRLFFCVLLFVINTLERATSAEADNRKLFKDEGLMKTTQTQPIVVDTSKTLQIPSSRYLSLVIDMDTFRWNWKGFDFSSEKLQNMAAALSPSYIRFGGLYTDFLQFEPHGKPREGPPPHTTRDNPTAEQAAHPDFFDLGQATLPTNFTMTGQLWDKVTAFCHKVEWDIMFSMNLFYWRDGLWDPSNAISFLKYSAARGVEIPVFLLGNEPNAFHHKFNFSIEGDVLAEDYRILRSVLARFPQYESSSLFGPGVTTTHMLTSSQYLAGFLKAGGCDTVNEVGIHQYYGPNNSTAEDFINPNFLDSLREKLDFAKDVTARECNVHKRIILTETSSCHGGGAVGLSDAYIAGFPWLDKLGLAAKYGVTHVLRQTFYGGSYSLIDEFLNPNPDYYLSVLYKRLIAGPVFDVISSSSTRRLYAHCARRDFYDYPSGALALYYLNLEAQNITFTSEQFFSNETVDLFELTPEDKMGLKSRFVKLNGQLLTMQGSDLPLMPARQHVGDVTVSAHSFGFIVIPSADVHACKIYRNFK